MAVLIKAHIGFDVSAHTFLDLSTPQDGDEVRVTLGLLSFPQLEKGARVRSSVDWGVSGWATNSRGRQRQARGLHHVN